MKAEVQPVEDGEKKTDYVIRRRKAEATHEEQTARRPETNDTRGDSNSDGGISKAVPPPKEERLASGR